jgi:hypothetical protein
VEVEGLAQVAVEAEEPRPDRGISQILWEIFKPGSRTTVAACSM